MLFDYSKSNGEILVQIDGKPNMPWEPLPSNHPLQRAVDIGRKVVEYEREGYEVQLPSIHCESNHGVIDATKVSISFPIIWKSKPLKGLAWLKSLPAGTRILSPRDGARMVVGESGLFFTHSGSFYSWDNYSRDIERDEAGEIDNAWTTACPATCAEWSPDVP